MGRYSGFGPHGFEDIEYFMGYGGGGSGYTFGGDIDRRSFAQVSDRALRSFDDAKALFLSHLAKVDTSSGAVTTEIIKFHLVPDMRKRFNKFVKEYGCTGTSRKITKEEQDLINTSRQSLMFFTSVKVTPAAQKAYLEKNVKLAQANAGSSKPGVAINTITATSKSDGVLTDATATVSKKRNASAAELNNGNSSAPPTKKAKA
ncbi:hypothetical protein HWV62_42500 [Athelia sp. TMB]|nr:hypothetical protein HWV62_42500 [Athelia sp. TMB]